VPCGQACRPVGIDCMHKKRKRTSSAASLPPSKIRQTQFLERKEGKNESVVSMKSQIKNLWKKF